jgi:hypothetical protein
MILIAIFSILIIPVGVSGDNNNEEGFIMVHIAENGHYRSEFFYLFGEAELEIEVEVVDGGKIDVYIMTDNQYSNAYTGFEGNKPSSISYLDASEENVSQFKSNYKIPEIDDGDEGYYYDYNTREICVVLDNQNSNLTDTDAVPIGPVSVRLKAIQHDQEFDEFVDPFCYAAIFIIIVLVAVIIIVIYLSLRKTKRKNVMPGEGTGKPPQFGQYPPYYSYPPYPYSGHHPPPGGAESEKSEPPKAEPKIDDTENIG